MTNMTLFFLFEHVSPTSLTFPLPFFPPMEYAFLFEPLPKIPFFSFPSLFSLSGADRPELPRFLSTSASLSVDSFLCPAHPLSMYFFNPLRVPLLTAGLGRLRFPESLPLVDHPPLFSDIT